MYFQVIAKSLSLKRKILRATSNGKKSKRGSKKKDQMTKTSGGGDTESKKGEQGSKGSDWKEAGDKKGPLSVEEEQILVLNLLFHFLFAELKDTPRLRQ